jgi:hypothetical protein
VWRDDGKKLFYRRGDVIMEVDGDGTGQFVFGNARALFTINAPTGFAGFGVAFAVTSGGKRFLVHASPERPSAQPLIVMFNWATGLNE